jgi:hypothetical protein
MTEPNMAAALAGLEDAYTKAQSFSRWHPEDGIYPCVLTEFGAESRVDKEKVPYVAFIAEFEILDGPLKGKTFEDFNTSKVASTGNSIGLSRVKDMAAAFNGGESFGTLQEAANFLSNQCKDAECSVEVQRRPNKAGGAPFVNISIKEVLMEEATSK